MPFNKNISGFKNEDEFVIALNKKHINELNPLFKDFILFLYPNVLNNNEIKCYKDYNKKKYDIIIKINNEIKYISIKKGVKNSVHMEPLSKFIIFLRNNGIPDTIINKYLLFHYADGTINGTGLNRISSEEFRINHSDDIAEINSYFNDINIIKAAVDRFIIYGNNSNIGIDAIIYGVIDDFIWITKEEIKKIIQDRNDIMRKGVGFGSLFCQPLNRCLNYNKKYEYERNYVQIKWYHLSDDIIESMYYSVNVKFFCRFLVKINVGFWQTLM